MKLTFSAFRTMMLSALLFVGMAVQARVISGVVKDATGDDYFGFCGRKRYLYRYSYGF